MKKQTPKFLTLLAAVSWLAACQDSPQAPMSVSRSSDQVAGSDALGGSIDFLANSSASTRRRPGIVAGDIADQPRIARKDIQLMIAQFGTDFVVGGVGGTRDVGSGNISISGISGTVQKATLYWHGPTSTTNTNVAVRVDGSEVSERSLGFSSDNCWGYANSQAWAADITNIVKAKGNGSYAITNLVQAAVNSNGASIVVYFDDGNSANNRDVVVFEGNDSNIDNSYDAFGWNVTLAGINYTAGTANMQLHVADGQSFPDDAITINGQPFLPAGGLFNGVTVPGAAPFGNGNLWDIRSFNVTSFLTPGSNTLGLRTGVGGDCLALVVALVDLPAGAAPPDLPSDNKAPDANAGADRTVQLNGATTANVSLNGSASTDDGQPNHTLTYTWSEGGTTLGTGAVLSVPLSLGTHTIRLVVSDGPLSDNDEVIITVVDPTPPVISSTVTGTLGLGGWYITPVQVSWTVTDLESAITSPACATGQQTSDTQGANFACTATSAGGTSSETVPVRKDATLPTVTYAGALNYTVDQVVSITCAATDATSGIQSSTCANISGNAYTFALGGNTRSASATDNAGNVGNASVTFNVQVTSASLCTLVRRWATQNGVANSLCVKLDAAEASLARGNKTAQQNQLGAFVNEVEAQSGKFVPADKAPILIALAKALL